MIIFEFSIEWKKIFDLYVCQWIKQRLISTIICTNILLYFILALFIDLAENTFFCVLLSAPALFDKGALTCLLDCAWITIEKFRSTITIFCRSLRMIIANALFLASFNFHRLSNILKRKRILFIVHPLNLDYYR